jgi:hypothetical protein
MPKTGTHKVNAIMISKEDAKPLKQQYSKVK